MKLCINYQWKENGKKCLLLVTDEMVETLGFCGTGEEVANSLKDDLRSYL